MNEDQPELIDVHHLRIGMFVDLQLGWMAHPFPSGSFKISSERQIEIIRELGLQKVSYFAGKSDLAQQAATLEQTGPSEARLEPVQASDLSADDQRRRQQRRVLLALQQQELLACDHRFADALAQYKQMLDQVQIQPHAAKAQCEDLVAGLICELLAQGESAIC